MRDSGNWAGRHFITLLAGVAAINLAYYGVAALLGRNASVPFMLQIGNWMYGVVVSPGISLAFSFIYIRTVGFRMRWVGYFIVACLILTFATINWAIYFLGGWLYA